MIKKKSTKNIPLIEKEATIILLNTKSKAKTGQNNKICTFINAA